MSTAPAHDVFRAILRASLAKLRPAFPVGEFKLEWDFENQVLRGSFEIPFKEELDPVGRYVLTAQDFLEDDPT